MERAVRHRDVRRVRGPGQHCGEGGRSAERGAGPAGPGADRRAPDIEPRRVRRVPERRADHELVRQQRPADPAQGVGPLRARGCTRQHVRACVERDRQDARESFDPQSNQRVRRACTRGSGASAAACARPSRGAVGNGVLPAQHQAGLRGGAPAVRRGIGTRPEQRGSPRRARGRGKNRREVRRCADTPQTGGAVGPEIGIHGPTTGPCVPRPATLQGGAAGVGSRARTGAGQPSDHSGEGHWIPGGRPAR